MLEVDTVDEYLSREPLISGQKIDPYSIAGNKFCEAHVLSEKAKKFSIAREIYQASDYSLNMRGGVWIMTAAGGYCCVLTISVLIPDLNDRRRGQCVSDFSK